MSRRLSLQSDIDSLSSGASGSGTSFRYQHTPNVAPRCLKFREGELAWETITRVMDVSLASWDTHTLSCEQTLVGWDEEAASYADKLIVRAQGSNQPAKKYRLMLEKQKEQETAQASQAESSPMEMADYMDVDTTQADMSSLSTGADAVSASAPRSKGRTSRAAAAAASSAPPAMPATGFQFNNNGTMNGCAVGQTANVDYSVPISAVQGSDNDLHIAHTQNKPSNGEPASATEAVLGKFSSAVPLRFLEALAWASEGVGMVADTKSDEGFGSGFMVSPILFLTNNHVLPDAKAAQAAHVVFGFFAPDGRKCKGLVKQETVELDPQSCFVTSKELDFTFVAIKGAARKVFHPLNSNRTILGKEPRVFILGHPDGRPMEASLAGRAEEISHGRLIYSSDTEGGSSGSPVFNVKWTAVALHNKTVFAYDDKGRPLRRDDKIWVEGKDDPSTRKSTANQGVLIHGIVTAMQRYVLNYASNKKAEKCLKFILEMLALDPLDKANDGNSRILKQAIKAGFKATAAKSHSASARRRTHTGMDED